MSAKKLKQPSAWYRMYEELEQRREEAMAYDSYSQFDAQMMAKIWVYQRVSPKDLSSAGLDYWNRYFGKYGELSQAERHRLEYSVMSQRNMWPEVFSTGARVRDYQRGGYTTSAATSNTLDIQMTMQSGSTLTGPSVTGVSERRTALEVMEDRIEAVCARARKDPIKSFPGKAKKRTEPSFSSVTYTSA